MSLAGFTTAVAAVLLGPIALIPAAVGVSIALAIARHHRADNERIHVAMEQVLDRLERAEIRSDQALPPAAHTFVRIAEEVRKALS